MLWFTVYKVRQWPRQFIISINVDIKQSKQFRNTVKYIKSVDFILNKSTKVRQLRETLVFSTDDTRTIEYFMSKIIENKSQLLPHIIKIIIRDKLYIYIKNWKNILKKRGKSSTLGNLRISQNKIHYHK